MKERQSNSSSMGTYYNESNFDIDVIGKRECCSHHWSLVVCQHWEFSQVLRKEDSLYDLRENGFDSTS